MSISSDRLESLRHYLQQHFVEEPPGTTAFGSVDLDKAVRPEMDIAESGIIAELHQPSTAKRRSKTKHAIREYSAPSRSLEDIVANPEETFSQSLFRLIRERGADEVSVYKRAGLDRKHFSKIRSNDDYNPKKPTVLSLAVALELNIDETLDLLGKAGFTLSHSSRSDLIVEYYISEETWDLFEINDALAAFEQPLLSAG